MKFGVLACAALAGGAMYIAAPAGAALIQTGTYRLHNHPDGSANPPPYGARIDELYNVTGSHDIFTFNFDHPQSAMFLDYTGSTVRIYGVSYGGRDVGTNYANDQYLGVYAFDFLYNVGVGLAPGDDDVMVTLPYGQYNYGTMLTPLGDTVSLRDGHYSGSQPDFRFGDENNDLGHRGFAGLSGWGWLFHALPGQPYVNYPASDWLFTAELVPAPGMATLLLGAGLLASRRRR